ncbi:MAG: hypothetical protein U9N52_03610 [Campylobacterota bacterium]|nr:hypothetical protein [Campylobacterota bacterium]
MKRKYLSILLFMTPLLFASDFSVECLKNETYYFPAKKDATAPLSYQALERFDLIFVGHNVDAAAEGELNLALSIPGYYTHILSYIGKDADGFAYAVEMNTDENKSVTFGLNGLEVNGQLYIYCLGNDFAKKPCPKDDYTYGMETYDYMWAKRLLPQLRERIMSYEKQLLQTIKDDLRYEYPFQLPMHLGLDILVNKEIPIIDDGRENGADCTGYFVSLFEEIAGVCMDDIRMSAEVFESYYRHNNLGMQAIIPAKYNLFYDEDIYFSKLLNEQEYSFINNAPRQSRCLDARMVVGMPTPNLVFNSPSMLDVDVVYVGKRE